ncbi:MAG: DapH/DapD/GlmU-related protein, partial [Candidatus Thorarchaeota archaeon]
NEDETVQIPQKKFGVIVGDKVVIGVNASIYPATRIGENSMISAGCVIKEDIPPGSEVSLTQKLVIKKRKDLKN